MEQPLPKLLFKNFIAPPKPLATLDLPLMLWSNLKDTDLSVLLANYRTLLPETLQKEVFRYRRKVDQANCLVGKLLLYAGHYLGTGTLLDFDTFSKGFHKKPFLLNSPLHFNISHSGHTVTSLFGTTPVGIDVEKIQANKLEDFPNLFTEGELKDITTGGMHRFFYYWTRKEAVVKANGKGMGIPFTAIDTQKPEIVLEQKKWRIHSFEWEGYACSYVLEEHLPKIQLLEMVF